MSYSVYTTHGFILGSSQSGEASKIYTLYTEEFGLIHAKAQSVRLLSSKLRFNLEEYSYGLFSLVKGREIWRLTGVENKTSNIIYPHINARILNLVRRLVQGEEKNEKLFKSLLFMNEIEKLKSFDSESLIAFESLVLVYALSSLGYLDAKMLLGIEGDIAPSVDHVGIIKAKKREVVSEINKALMETQL
jgi:recombinational DNA repair protein (RecF pathway)